MLRDNAELVDRTISSESCAPAPVLHRWTGEGPEELRHALSSAEVSKREEMTRFSRSWPSLQTRKRIRDGIVEHCDTIPAQLERSRDHFQISLSKYYYCGRAAKR